MQQGWIKIHRQLTEWEWYDDLNTFRLFISKNIINKANINQRNNHQNKFTRHYNSGS